MSSRDASSFLVIVVRCLVGGNLLCRVGEVCFLLRVDVSWSCWRRADSSLQSTSKQGGGLVNWV